MAKPNPTRGTARNNKGGNSPTRGTARNNKGGGNNTFQSVVSDPVTTSISVDYGSTGKAGSKSANRNIKMYQDVSQLANFEFALDEGAREFEAATVQRELQKKQAEDTFINQMKMRDIQMNAQLQAYTENQQLVANQLAFNQQGAESALRDSETVLGDRLKQIQFQEQELGFRREEQAIATASQLASLQVGDFEAQQNKRLADADAERNKFLRDTAANLQYRKDISSADYELETQQAETAFQLQQNNIQEIVNLGKVRSSGRTGVSASRAEQTILALAGMNTSQLNNSLNRFTLNTAKEKGFIGEQQDVSKASNQAEFTSATTRAAAQEKVALAKSSIDNTRLKEIETVTNNRFEMNREELGETLISALNGYEQSKEQIFFDKFKADSQAYAQRMAEPQFADAPKEPFKIPKIKYIQPPVPIETPTAGSARQPQNKTSTFGKILQIGGMIAAAAAIPITAGASAAIAAGAAASATAMSTGVGLAIGGAAAQGVGGSGWI